MTEPLFRTDPYLAEAAAQVAAHTPEGGVVLDQTVFYPTGGGQPGDHAALDANPGLVKTMPVPPPRGRAHVGLIRIGQGADQVDLQRCGSTHVARTGEIGAVRLGKVEKKGRQTRRVYLHIDD